MTVPFPWVQILVFGEPAMTNKFAAALIAGGMLALCTPALAVPSHCPPGHAKKGWCNPGGYQSRESNRYDGGYERRGARADYDSDRRTFRFDDRRSRY